MSAIVKCFYKHTTNPNSLYVSSYSVKDGIPSYDKVENPFLAATYSETMARTIRDALADYYGTDFSFYVSLPPLDDKGDSVSSTAIEATLSQRGARYGDFTENAKLSQAIKEVMYKAPYSEKLNAVHKEALEAIAQKISRILNGDPDYKDNWHDIAGYAKLAEDRCVGDKE